MPTTSTNQLVEPTGAGVRRPQRDRTAGVVRFEGLLGAGGSFGYAPVSCPPAPPFPGQLLAVVEHLEVRRRGTDARRLLAPVVEAAGRLLRDGGPGADDLKRGLVPDRRGGDLWPLGVVELAPYALASSAFRRSNDY